MSTARHSSALSEASLEILVPEMTHRFSETWKAVLCGLALATAMVFAAQLQKKITWASAGALLGLAVFYWIVDGKTKRKDVRIFLKSAVLLSKFFRIQAARISNVKVVLDALNFPLEFEISSGLDVFEFKNTDDNGELLLAWLTAYLPKERIVFENEQADD